MRNIVIVFMLGIIVGLPMMAQGISGADSILLTNAFKQKQAGNDHEALEGFLKVGQNTKGQKSEEERTAYVISQRMAIMCYEQLKQYQDGFDLSEQLLKEKLTDEEREDVQQLYVINGYCVALSAMHKSNRRYAEARATFDKILLFADADMKKRILSRIPISWYFEGISYQINQQYDKALPCMEEARRGFHEAGDTKSETDALCQMGAIKSTTYNVMGAVEAYQEARRLASATNNETKLMSVLKELRKLSNLIGDTEQSVGYDLQMDSLMAQTENVKAKFEYYSYKGDEAKGQGNYQLAERWYMMNEAYVGQLKADYMGAERYLHYTNLRKLYAQAGRYDEALTYAEKGKKEFWRHNGASTPQYYMPYMAIADIYRLKQDRASCFASLDTLFLALEKQDEPKEKEQLYITRGRCHAAFKSYERALADYQEADRVLATQYGEDDGDRVRLLALMGGMEHRLKHYEESERLYRAYAKRIGKIYGDRHNEYINALGYLANAEGFTGHLDLACGDYMSAVERLKEQTQQRMPYLNTAEREEYWKQVSKLIQDMTPFALEAKEYQTSFTEACYDGLVLSKAFLLVSERSTYDLIRSKGTDEDLRLFSQIASMQAKLREWENEGTSRTDSLLALTSRTKQIEAHLAKRCRSYGDMTTFMSIGNKEIREKLKDGDVLIDFTDFASESRGRVYAAYLVDNKQEHPLLQKLFAESKIDSMQVEYPDQYYESPYAETMYQLLWMPFKDKVAEGATVYYVPSQLLFQISLESLPMEDGTLLGEHYDFVRLSSARELVRLEANKEIDMASESARAVLYGGLLYDLKADEWEAEASKYEVSSLMVVRGGTAHGDSIHCPLPGTKKEVDSIAVVLKAHQVEVTSYTGKMGTEESFLDMSGQSPRLLHVATHGFYYTPDEAQDIDYLKGYKDAMLLSGLVMSGGDAAWLGRELPEGVLGGILTASNIARLDLSKTKLVVLSACQSGSGKATPEGLYGLQRAFKRAGVETMVMSLWNVSDMAGTEFMTKFYENLTSNGWNKRKAFNDAKTYIRGRYAYPYYWAGFVMLD